MTLAFVLVFLSPVKGFFSDYALLANSVKQRYNDFFETETLKYSYQKFMLH